MTKKDNVCFLCGEPCYGKTCTECFHKGKYSSLAKSDSRKRHYVKQM